MSVLKFDFFSHTSLHSEEGIVERLPKNPSEFVSIPVHIDQCAAIFHLSEGKISPAAYIYDVLAEHLSNQFQHEDSITLFGITPHKFALMKADWESYWGRYGEGMWWGSAWLPNGTLVRSRYKGKHKNLDLDLATVRHGSLFVNEQKFSPSHFANEVAGGTNRNAWNDLECKFQKTEWIKAKYIRNHHPFGTEQNFSDTSALRDDDCILILIHAGIDIDTPYTSPENKHERPSLQFSEYLKLKRPEATKN
ncbi:hypothetical protein [Sneathiella chinensis]|uniref:Uncharacterized protein n=1 Tax=Sneathiella chinensis TaxID=349750 RepID=A0ABQ5U3G9_9PROT|nr:hypothetical protein [Sneathiella chinensis]GLQ06607.1 hypothetical protein GCM10007924_18280 [Sneathiella chinensis]